MTEQFARLLAKRERQEFDDEYLRLADAYEAGHPHSEAPAVFRGAYALAHDDVQQAFAQAKRAFSLRPLNFEVWQLFVRCPGQIYRCAIRTLDHEFQMRSHEFVDEDGAIDLRNIDTELYERNHPEMPGGHLRIEDAALQKEFLDVLHRHTATIDRGGDQWPSMRAARPEWFGTAERKERRG